VNVKLNISVQSYGELLLNHSLLFLHPVCTPKSHPNCPIKHKWSVSKLC